MFNREEKKMNDLMKSFLKENQALDQKLKEEQVIAAWRAMLTEGLETYIRSIYYKNNTLYVKTTSAVLRKEFLMNRTSLLNRLHEELGSTKVKEIVIR